MMKKMLSASALSIAILLSACKKDDPKPSCENGAFTMTLNGEEVSATSFENTLIKASIPGAASKRMDIRATDESGRQVIITISDPSTGTNGDGISTDEYIPFDDVTSPTENTFFFSIYEQGQITNGFTDGELDITSCDADNRKVSGTFSFSDGDFVITNGSFTDMCYSVTSN
jgi:hypothetical protein